MLCQWDGKPSISRCLDHSAGKSVRRAMPMPYGSRPSMAALTRSGARKASEIVMLTFRRLHRSRFAMRSVVSDASIVSSLSHRRPRAMAATSVARVSERIGRACCGGIPSGKRISRRRVNGVLCQGRQSVMMPIVDKGTSRRCFIKFLAGRSGRSPYWVKVKNPNSSAVKREAEEDWGR
jgi:hypothetical protein